MRITDRVLHNRVLRNVQQVRDQLAKNQERISSQKNIAKPSDDPVGFVRIMGYYRDLYKLRQTEENARDASLILNQMDTDLQAISDLVLEARTEASAMASDTVGASDRLAVADEIQLIIDDILQKTNSKLGSRYLFSGHRIFTQPYQEVDGRIRYMGNNGTMEQRIELNGTIVVNIPGPDVFGGSVFPTAVTVQDATIADAGPPPTGLDNGTIEDELSRAFATEIAPLTSDATVTVDVAGERWQINDNSKTYYIENYSAGADDNRLTIYTADPFGLTTLDATIADAGPPPTGLDNGTIEDEVRDAFAANDLTLSSEATVSVDAAGERWQITDGSDVYHIENYNAGADDNRLMIYPSDAGGLFKVLEDLRDALRENNVSGIVASQDLIDVEIDRIAGVRGELGVKMKRVESSMSQLELQNVSLTSEIAEIGEVDLAIEAAEYMANQTAYQAALEVTASTLQLPKLLDYMK